MAQAPHLAGERIDLLPFADVFLTEKYVGWLNDPEIVRFSEQRHRHHTLDTCRAYARSFDTGPHLFWAIVAKDMNLSHVGNITAIVDTNNRTANLAIMIGDKRARGQGLGLEAWRCACRHLLTTAGLRKVAAGTMATNEPMLRIMHASGMRQEGRLHAHFLVDDGEPVDCILAGLFASSEG